MSRVAIGGGWDEVIGDEFEKEYYLKLREFLKAEYSSQKIYPDMYDIFNALKLTPYNEVKAVILGQDGTELPPSLKNIYKELETDVGIKPASSGDLTPWAKQGVLLLNAVLTVRQGRANSHKGMGWELFTDEVIKKLNESDTPIAFILWGSNARSKKALITNPIHGIFESAHPSPLSAYGGFFGSKVFSRVNKFLIENEIPPIDWRVEK